MDDLDLKILDIVQRNNLLSAASIARQVGLSPSAAQRRLNQLRESKVIERDVSTVSPDAVGRGFIAIVSIALDSESPQIRRQFARLIEETPEVMQCYYVTGEGTDFFLVVTARNMNDYHELMTRLTDQFPRIKRFSTYVVMERVKSGLTIPVTG
jgi:Lrp/AsnC family leucine-responsive transcriptional regulator